MLICGALLFLQETCAAAVLVGGASVAVASVCEVEMLVAKSAKAPAAVASAAPARSATSTGLRIGRDRFARPEPPECQKREQCGQDQERCNVKSAVAEGVHRVAGFRDHCLEAPDGGALELCRPGIDAGVRVALRPDHRVVAAEA